MEFTGSEKVDFRYKTKGLELQESEKNQIPAALDSIGAYGDFSPIFLQKLRYKCDNNDELYYVTWAMSILELIYDGVKSAFL